MTKHTPGPWEYQDAHEMAAAVLHVDRCWEVGISAEAEGLALVPGNEANARLIAAAPDLLVACEAALNERMFKDWPDVATLLIKAIKKATSSD
jgi:hypothetical protein